MEENKVIAELSVKIIDTGDYKDSVYKIEGDENYIKSAFICLVSEISQQFDVFEISEMIAEGVTIGDIKKVFLEHIENAFSRKDEEPEKEEQVTFLNAKVVCIDDNSGNAPFAKGNVYEVHDGIITPLDEKILCGARAFRVKSLDHLNSLYSNVKFVEIKTDESEKGEN